MQKYIDRLNTYLYEMSIKLKDIHLENRRIFIRLLMFQSLI